MASAASSSDSKVMRIKWQKELPLHKKCQTVFTQMKKFLQSFLSVPEILLIVLFWTRIWFIAVSEI